MSVPLTLSVSKLVQLMKVRSSGKLLQEDRNLQKQYWGQHLWARGYFVVSSGNITDEMIKECIENQDVEKRRILEFQDLKWAFSLLRKSIGL